VQLLARQGSSGFAKVQIEYPSSIGTVRMSARAPKAAARVVAPPVAIGLGRSGC
jgi:hypothetical protein